MAGGNSQGPENSSLKFENIFQTENSESLREKLEGFDDSSVRSDFDEVREAGIRILENLKKIKSGVSDEVKNKFDADSTGGVDVYEKLSQEFRKEIDQASGTFWMDEDESIDVVHSKIMGAQEKLEKKFDDFSNMLETQEAVLGARVEGEPAWDRPVLRDSYEEKYVFIDASKKPKITDIINDEKFGGVENVELDYTKMDIDGHGQNVKKKMEQFFRKGTEKVYITKWVDAQENKTWVVLDAQWNPTTQRAFVWPGVEMRIMTAAPKNQEAFVLDDFGAFGGLDTLKDGQKEQLQKVVDRKIDDLISMWQQNGRSPASDEPFEKIWNFDWILESVAYDEDGNRHEQNFLSKRDVDEGIYDVLDDNESDFLKYVTKKVREKRSIAQDLAATNVEIADEEKILEQNRSAIASMLENYTKFLENLAADDEGDEDAMHAHINKLKSFAKKLSAGTLKKSELGGVILDDSSIAFSALKAFASSFTAGLYGNQWTVADKFHDFVKGMTTDLKSAAGAKDAAKSMKSRDAFLAKLREMDALDGDYEASHISETLDEWLSIENDSYQKILDWFRGAGEKFLEADDEEQAKFLGLLDASSEQDFGTKLMAILPKWPPRLADDEVEKLYDVVKKFEKNLPTTETVKDGLRREKELLEKKWEQQGSLSTEEKIRLDSLTAILTGEDDQGILEKSLKTAKIQWLASLLENSGSAMILEKAYENDLKITGPNADIYGDIHGFGTWNFSDETVNWAIEITKMIAEEIAIFAVAMAAGALTGGAGAAAIYAVRAAAVGARVARVARVGSKIFRGAKKVASGLKLGRNAQKTTAVARVGGNTVRKVAQSGAKIMERGVGLTQKIPWSQAIQKLTAKIPGTASRRVWDLSRVERLGVSLAKATWFTVAQEGLKWNLKETRESGDFITKVVQNGVMLGILERAGVIKNLATRLIVEEVGMALNDFAFESLKQREFTLPELTDLVENMAMWVAFELLFGVKILGVRGETFDVEVDGRRRSGTVWALMEQFWDRIPKNLRVKQDVDMKTKELEAKKKEFAEKKKEFAEKKKEFAEKKKEFAEKKKEFAEKQKYYKILGVAEDASDDEIRSAYRQLVKKKHPDSGGSDQEFIEIKNAHDQILWKQSEIATLKKDLENLTSEVAALEKNIADLGGDVEGRGQKSADEAGVDESRGEREADDWRGPEKIIDESRQLSSLPVIDVKEGLVDGVRVLDESTQQSLKKEKIWKEGDRWYAEALRDEFPPKFAVEVEWKTFYFDKMYNSNGRDFTVMYSEIDGRLEPFVVYYSQSWQNWHISEYFRANGAFSKFDESKYFPWNSYEKWWLLDDSLQKQLSSIREKYGAEGKSLRSLSDKYAVLSRDWIADVDSFKGRLGRLWKEFEADFPFFEANHSGWARAKTWTLRSWAPDGLSQLSQTFENIGETIKKNFDLDSARVEKLDDSPAIQIPGSASKSQTETWKMTMKKKWAQSGDPEYHVLIRRVKWTDQFWVENITRSDSQVNVLGLHSVQVAGGILTSKPFDYWEKEQLPDSFGAKSLGKTEYFDVRPFLQENPLIQQFLQKKPELRLAAKRLDFSGASEIPLSSRQEYEIPAGNFEIHVWKTTFRVEQKGGDVDLVRADGSTISIPQWETYFVWRGEKNDLRFDDDSVSRQHLRIENRDGRLIFMDLGSTNGTKILKIDAAPAARPVVPENLIDSGEKVLLSRAEKKLFSDEGVSSYEIQIGNETILRLEKEWDAVSIFQNIWSRQQIREIRPGENVSFGRGEKGFIFSDPTISRSHFTIENRDGEIFIKDHSSNGTRLTAKTRERTAE